MGNDDEIKGVPPSGSSRTPRHTLRSSAPAGREEGAVSSDSEARELMARSRSLFLRDVERQLAKKDLYNLDEEFARTRHNRSPIVWLSVLVFVSVMVVVAVAVTSEIQRRSQEVPVNVTAFADVNLRDILDRAKQLDLQMRTARQTLGDLQSSEAAQIRNARNNAEQQIQVVDAQLLAPSEKVQREDAIRSQLAAQVGEIRVRFGGQISDARKKIEEIQKELDHYDARQVEEARKQEAILNNQQRIFDMQMTKTVGYYEERIRELTDQFTNQIQTIRHNDSQLVSALKQSHATEVSNLIATYNPTFTSPEIADILNRPIDVTPQVPDSFSRVVVEHRIAEAGGLSEMEGRMQEFETLLARLRQIPYKNSVPVALDHLQALSQEIVSTYQLMANGLAATVSEESQVIGAYNHALSSLINSSRENGYIIDPRDASRIVVFVAPIYTVKDGESAFVFRKDDEPIGTIRLSVTPAGITGSLVSLAKSTVPMKPFDKILLDVKQ